MPATIDTPFFQHAGNYTGRATKAMPPVYPAERVARAIVRMVQRPRREMFVGNSGRQFNLLSFVAPGLAERLMARMVDRQHLYQDVPAAPTPGKSLPAPGGGHGQQRWMDAPWAGSRGPRRPAGLSRRGARRPGPPVAASPGALPVT
jgi:hypothetical protein